MEKGCERVREEQEEEEEEGGEVRFEGNKGCPDAVFGDDDGEKGANGMEEDGEGFGEGNSRGSILVCETKDGDGDEDDEGFERVLEEGREIVE